MRAPLWIATALVLAGALLSGCATYRLDVSSLSAGELIELDYVILPGNAGTAPSDLEFQQYADYMARALAAEGYAPAANPLDASVVIALAYGLDSRHDINVRMRYHRFYLTVRAFDGDAYRANQQRVELWRTTVNSRGLSGDLRATVAAMVAAAAPYFGEQTSQQVHAALRDDSPAVLEIKGL